MFVADRGTDIIAQVVNQGTDVNRGSFDLQVGDGGFGLFDSCSSPDTTVPMYPGNNLSVWGRRYGGVVNQSQCADLPKYPICSTFAAQKSPLIIENLPRLCQESFQERLRGLQKINQACIVKCPGKPLLVVAME